MQTKNKQQIVGFSILCIALVAAGAFVFWQKNQPQELQPDQVFSDILSKKNIVQVSLYSLSEFKDGTLYGGGHVRYNKDGMITGFGDAPHGAPVTIRFNDTKSAAFKACAELINQGIPLKKELFIAGVGMAGSNGLVNPATGRALDLNEITYSSITGCDYAAIQ